MAGAVVLMRRIALDADVGVLLRWTGILAFALDPMVVLCGANGMSEAAFLFVLLWAYRPILQWRRAHGALDLF